MNANDIYTWSKSGWRAYVLRRGDGSEAGRVTFEGFCSTTARAVVRNESWTFRRSGVFRQSVTVLRGGDSPALFTGSYSAIGRCEIALDDGNTYRWKATSCLRGEYAWFGTDGTASIRYRPQSWLRGEQRIEVASAALPRETALLLALLGGFLRVLANNDAAAASAAVIAVVVAS